MRRRDFVFTSAKAAALLGPLLSARRAAAQDAARPKRVVFWMVCSGYPDASAFFPTGTESNFQLSPILAGLESVKGDLVIIDGVNLRETGLNPRSNNHIRTPGKIFTAKDIIEHPTDPANDGLPGGISIDQLLRRDLRLSSIELQVHSSTTNHIRARPFATGPSQFAPPTALPEVAWDRLFKGFSSSRDGDLAAEQTRLRGLQARKSLLDDLVTEMKRFRSELDGAERMKLDMHEDAIRRAEESVVADMAPRPPASSACVVPARATSSTKIPLRAKAQLDLLYAALACDRVQVAGLVWGYSGYSWLYDWVPEVITGGIHDEVHHNPTGKRDMYLRSAAWDWAQIGAFASRLKATPEGTGTMLDNTLLVVMSHFSIHHRSARLPVVLIGNAAGQLQTNRYLKLTTSVFNDKVLTSVAHLMGLPIAGIGDDAQCGPLPQLHRT